MSTPEELLARAGKSFHLAGKFLPPERRAAATRLYAFCRGLDDLADETGDAAQIETVAKALEINDRSHPLAALYLTLESSDPAPAVASPAPCATTPVRPSSRTNVPSSATATGWPERSV